MGDTIDKLEELARKATRGPWRAANGQGSASVACKDCAIYINVRTCEVDECVERWQADARYIAACSPATILPLLERYRAMERVVAAGRAWQSSRCRCGYGLHADNCTLLRLNDALDALPATEGVDDE